MNKSGQYVFVGIMISIMVIIVLVQFIGPIKDQLILSRAELNCTSEDLTFGQRGTCIVMDATLFYFIGTGLATIGAIIAGRHILKINKPNE